MYTPSTDFFKINNYVIPNFHVTFENFHIPRELSFAKRSLCTVILSFNCEFLEFKLMIYNFVFNKNLHSYTFLFSCLLMNWCTYDLQLKTCIFLSSKRTCIKFPILTAAVQPRPHIQLAIPKTLAQNWHH